MGGWLDSFAKHYPFAAFVAEVISNIFHEGEKQLEGSSYGYYDHPRQIQYTPSPKNNNRYSGKENRRDEKRASRHVDYSATVVDDWHMKSHRVLQQSKAYEERGVLTRKYKDSKGKEVVEQRHYRVKKYEEHQLSPVRMDQSRRSKHGSRRHEIVSSRDHRKKVPI